MDFIQFNASYVRERPGFSAMPAGFQLATTRIACVLLAAAMTGCACSCPRCAPTSCLGWQANCSPTNACFGYFSTCWRSWPPECAPCPSFATVGTSPESVPLPELPPRPPSPDQNSDLPAPEPPPAPTNMLPGFTPPNREEPEDSARLPKRLYGATPLPVSFKPARRDSR